MKKRLTRTLYSPTLGIWLVFALLAMLTLPAMGATSASVTINATPAYVSITSTPDNWTVNGDAGGTGTIAVNTEYYANPTSDIQPPSATINATACRFTMNSTSSVAIDVTVNMGNFTGGDAMVNANTGNNTAGGYGGWTWKTGDTYPADRVLAQSAGSPLLNDALAANTNFTWGAEMETQSGAWTSSTQMTTTMTISAVAD